MCVEIPPIKIYNTWWLVYLKHEWFELVEHLATKYLNTIKEVVDD